jgi:carbamoylphosphate synthase large subunit
MARASWRRAQRRPWPTLEEVDLPAGLHPWFRTEIARAREILASGDIAAAKRAGWGDDTLGEALGLTGTEVRQRRHELGIRPVFRRVDSCAGEVDAASNYLYSTWGEEDEAPPTGEARRVVILGSGPNRIGQGIEFDYCCVHAAQTFRTLGYEAVMVNCNPETVSTDYDTSDRLYFEPLSPEEVLAVCDREQPIGVVTQFGRSDAPAARTRHRGGRLSHPRHAARGDRPRRGPRALWPARRRARRALPALGDRLGRRGSPRCGRGDRLSAPRPPVVRAGGRAMRICYDPDQLEAAMAAVQGTVLLDRFVENAIELDVDALCDGTDVYIAAVMQHVEEAGVHSGDSACVLPAPSLTLAAALEVEHVVRRLGPALGVVGILNVQLAIADSNVYVLEVNPRASRTVPFASKAIGVNLVDAACRLAAGAHLPELDLPVPRPTQVSVKAAVLPVCTVPGRRPRSRPRVRSTGDVMASAADLPTALRRRNGPRGVRSRRRERRSSRFATRTSPRRCPSRLLSRDSGFELVATEGTARTCARPASRSRRSPRVADADLEEETVVDLVRNGRCDPRHQYAAGQRRARRRLPHPRGGARRACAVRDDDLRAPPRPCTRSRTRAPSRRSRCRSASGSRRERPPRARRGRRGEPSARTRCFARARRARAGHPGQFFMLEAPGGCSAPDEPLPGAAGELAFLMEPIGPGTRRCARSSPGRDPRARAARERLRPRRRGRCSSRRHRDRADAVPREALGAPRRSRVSAATPRGGGAAPGREVVVEPRLVTELLPDEPHDVLACGPEPMLEASRARPDAQLAWEAPMACGYGRATAASWSATALRASVRRGPVLQGRRVIALLNASGCLDALTAPRSHGARRVRDEDGHAAPARETAAADRGDDSGMLNSIGLQNPGIERSSRADCRVCGSWASDLGVGGGSRAETTPRVRALDDATTSQRSS